MIMGLSGMKRISIAKVQCPETEWENRSSEPKTKFDEKVMEASKIACRDKFPRSPCLKKLIKLRPREHFGICGPMSRNTKTSKCKEKSCPTSQKNKEKD